MMKTAMVLLLVVSAVSMFGSPHLQPAETVCTTCAPAIGDFNGDGLDDFFVALNATELYFNLGGRFGPPIIASGMRARDVVIVVGDVNGDGLDDVIVQKPGGPSGGGGWERDGPQRLMINEGSGRFITAPKLPGHVVQMLDFDLDGNADLVIVSEDDLAESTDGGVSRRTTALRLMRGNGDGTFTFHQRLPFPDTRDGTTSPPFGVGDLNSDGRPDLVQQRGRYLHFYFAGPDGQFGAPRSRFTFLEPQEQHVFDVNGDGLLDLVFISWFGREDTRVTALFGDGRGGFPAVSHLSLSSGARRGPRNLAVADFYAGGANEIAVGVAENQVLMLAATNNQLREVARLEVETILDPTVYAGRFRREATYDLMVALQETQIPGRHITDLVLAEGVIEPAVQVRQARVGSRTRAVRSLPLKIFEGTYNVDLQSDCSISLPSRWTILEEGLFADFVTGSGLRIEGAVIDGGINVRFFVADGGRTRTFEGLFERAGNVLKGTLYEYGAPCGGRWATHNIELTRSVNR